MTNTQRKKIKMLVSYKEGYYKPPYPYTLRVRGMSQLNNRPPYNYTGLVHAGCGVCKGYGYTNTRSYNQSDNCTCVTNHHGIYSKKAYRFN